MPKVVVVFTGGTISTAFDPASGGNVPVLDGEAIIARTPGLDAVAEVAALDLGRTPASHFTFPMLLDIAATVRDALVDPEVDGAVVVQGTDTIEETSFCWDLVLEGPKPVVVTGAMRASDAPGFDGPANLRDAVRVAADPRSRDCGRRRLSRWVDRAGGRRGEDAHVVADDLREPERRLARAGR